MRKILNYLLSTTVLLLTSSAAFPAFAATSAIGSNVKSPLGTVYTITTENGQIVRRPYSSAGAFLSYGYNSWSGVIPETSDDIQLPVGSLIPPQDGKIMCSDRGDDKGTCYVITAGTKAGLASSAIFLAQGYSFSRVLTGDISFLPAGPTISSGSQAHAVGALINNNGTVELIVSSPANGMSATQFYGIANLQTFLSWGFSMADVVTADQADKQATMVGLLPTRQVGQIIPAYVNIGNVPQTTTTTYPSTGSAPLPGVQTANPAPSNQTNVIDGSINLQLDLSRPYNSSAAPGQTGVTVMNFALSNNTTHAIGIDWVGFSSDSAAASSNIAQLYFTDQSGNRLTSSPPQAQVSGVNFSFYFNTPLVINPQTIFRGSILADIGSSAGGGFRLAPQNIGFDRNYQIPDSISGNLNWWSSLLTITASGSGNSTTTATTTTTATSTAVTTNGIMVTSPTAAISLTAGQSYTIQWQAPGLSYVTLALYKGSACTNSTNGNISLCGQSVSFIDSALGTVYTTTVPNTGSYSWTVPASSVAGSDYHVIVGSLTSLSGTTFQKASQSPAFSIGVSQAATTTVTTTLTATSLSYGSISSGSSNSPLERITLSSDNSDIIVSAISFKISSSTAAKITSLNLSDAIWNTVLGQGTAPTLSTADNSTQYAVAIAPTKIPKGGSVTFLVSANTAAGAGGNYTISISGITATPAPAVITGTGISSAFTVQP